MLGRTREAADTLAEAIERIPDAGDLYAHLVQLLAFDLGEQEVAEKRLAEALDLDTESYSIQMAAFRMAIANEDLATAETHLQRALELGPDTLNTLLPGATFYLAQNRFSEAEDLLDRAKAAAPQDRRVLLKRSELAIRQDDTQAVLDIADTLVTLSEDKDPRLLTQAVELYRHAGRVDLADEYLARLDAFTRDNGAAGVWAEVDWAHSVRALEKGDAHEAIARLTRVLEHRPRATQVLQLLANAYDQAGDLGAAADTLARLLVLTPHDAGARLQSAEVAWKRGRLQDVRDAVAALSGASERQRRQGQLIELACDLEQAARDGQPGDTSGSLHKINAITGMLGEEAQPTDLTVWQLRCLALTGLADRAVALVDKYMDDARRAPALALEASLILLSQGQADSVLALADRLVDSYAEAVDAHRLRVMALARLNRFDELQAHVSSCGLTGINKGLLMRTVGDECYRAGRKEEARLSYADAAVLMPRHIPVRKALASFAPDIGEATRVSEEIKQIEGEDGVQWRFVLAEALLRLQADQPESVARARELLEGCLAHRPRWWYAQLLLGMAYDRAAMLENAARAYQSAIELNPVLSNGPVAIRCIELLKRLGRFGTADVMLDALVKASPDRPEVLRLRTDRRLRERDFEAALTTAEALMHIEPEDPAVAATTADLYLRVGDAPRAEATARAALEQFPGAPQALWSLALALVAQDRGHEAEQIIREEAAAADDAAHYLLHAQILARLDRWDEAEQPLEKAQQSDPDRPAIWEATAVFWGNRQDRSRQLEAMRKAITLRGIDPAESLDLARLLANGENAKQRAEANAIVEQVLNNDPKSAPALVLKAQMLLMERPESYEQAQSLLEAATESQPRYAAAWRLLADLQTRTGTLTEASETVGTGLAYVPNDVDLRLTAAGIHCHQGRYGQAIAMLQRLIQQHPRNIEALRQLALARREMGQAGEAIAFIEQTLPTDGRTAEEVTVLAKLYEADDRLDQAETLFREAHALSNAPTKTFVDLLQFYARTGAFTTIQDLGRTERDKSTQDPVTIMAAGEILAGRAPDQTTRDMGLDWLEDVAKQHPDHAADALFRAGMCLHHQGDLAGAEARLSEALERAPGAVAIVNAVAWLYGVDLDRAEKAREVVDRFLADGGRPNASLLDTYGTILTDLGDFDLAEQQLARCLEVAGQTPTLTAANYHMALLMIARQRPYEAHAYLDAAMNLDDRVGGLSDEQRTNAQTLRLSAGTSDDDESTTGEAP